MNGSILSVSRRLHATAIRSIQIYDGNIFDKTGRGKLIISSFGGRWLFELLSKGEGEGAAICKIIPIETESR